MKKLAVVLGVAAVATFTGCKDPDYAGRKAAAPEEVKSIETEPVTPPPAEEPKIEVVEKKCTCLPGTKHAAPCACGASDCKCVVEAPVVVKPAVVKPVEPETTIYIVQNGDYLAKISKRYNVTINSIKTLNNLKSDKILIGQKLKLPGKIDVGEQKMPVNAKAKSAKKSAKKVAPKQVAKKSPAKPAEVKPAVKEAAKSAEAVKPAEEVKPVEAAEVKPTEVAPAAEVATPAAEVAPAAPAAEVKPAMPATTTYVVQEGEDITRIAVDFGVTPAVIRELNGLNESDQLKPGQVLKIPAESQD